ncbi:MAG: NERD domain-containing protein [Lachnospiraceae bacterium]|nr:NERD domain-containing protein [Lachnospiraceae bacterium]
MDNEIIIIILAVLFVVFLISIFTRRKEPANVDPPEKRAGKIGEQYAKFEISKVLWETDILLNNISITADGKTAEYDNIIINRYGVFIIEVKNHVGKLYGSEDDYDWVKVKTTPGGYSYEKTVKNPIKQVKRQIYILSKYLKDNGIKAWIDGYIFFVNHNSPVDSKYILNTITDIDKVIHDTSREKLKSVNQTQIISVLKNNQVL